MTGIILTCLTDHTQCVKIHFADLKSLHETVVMSMYCLYILARMIMNGPHHITYICQVHFQINNSRSCHFEPTGQYTSGFQIYSILLVVLQFYELRICCKMQKKNVITVFSPLWHFKLCQEWNILGHVSIYDVNMLFKGPVLRLKLHPKRLDEKYIMILLPHHSYTDCEHMYFS